MHKDMLNIAYIGPLDPRADLHFSAFFDRANEAIVGQWDTQSSRPNDYGGLLKYKNLDRLLDDSAEIDAVIVAAEPGAQIPIIHRALDAGKHILFEMPILSCQAELKALYEAFEVATAQKTTMALALPDRFDPAVCALQKTVADFRTHYPQALELTVQSPAPETFYLNRDGEAANAARECAAYDLALACFVSGEPYLGFSFTAQAETSYRAVADLAGHSRAFLSADYGWAEKIISINWENSIDRRVLPSPGVEAYTAMHDAWIKAVRGEAPYPVEKEESVMLATVGVQALAFKNPLSLRR